MMRYESDVQRGVTKVDLRGKHTRTLSVPAQGLSPRAGQHDEAAARGCITRMIYKTALRGKSKRRRYDDVL